MWGKEGSYKGFYLLCGLVLDQLPCASLMAAHRAHVGGDNWHMVDKALRHNPYLRRPGGVSLDLPTGNTRSVICNEWGYKGQDVRLCSTEINVQ